MNHFELLILLGMTIFALSLIWEVINGRPENEGNVGNDEEDSNGDSDLRE